MDTAVPPEVGAHAVAVVRDAVSTAIRHGDRQEVVLTVEAGADPTVEVHDDGIGIDPTAARR